MLRRLAVIGTIAVVTSCGNPDKKVENQKVPIEPEGREVLRRVDHTQAYVDSLIEPIASSMARLKEAHKNLNQFLTEEEQQILREALEGSGNVDPQEWYKVFELTIGELSENTPKRIAYEEFKAAWLKFDLAWQN